MTKKKKIIISVVAVVVIILVIPCAIYVVDSSVLFLSHRAIVSSTPDTSDWKLENDEFKIVPVIDEDTVTFYVEDKDGNLIFEPEQSWRDWDFKYVNIDENSVITASSGDMGEYIYKLNEDGSFYLASPVC